MRDTLRQSDVFRCILLQLCRTSNQRTSELNTQSSTYVFPLTVRLKAQVLRPKSATAA